MVGKGTPWRSFRIPDALYEAALARAQAEGRSLSEVVRTLLAEWIDSDGAPETVDE